MGKMECQEDKDLLIIIQPVVAKPPKYQSGTQTNRQHCLSSQVLKKRQVMCYMKQEFKLLVQLVPCCVHSGICGLED